MKDGPITIESLACLVAWSFCCLLQSGCHSSNDTEDTNSDTDTDTITDSDSDTDTETEFEEEFFDISVTMSSKIGTVAIVEWSTTHESFDNAHIEYGPDDAYGMIAPVDLEEPDFRTLLLGMKPSTGYQFRIVLTNGDKTYKSDGYPVETGPVPNGLPTTTLITADEGAHQGGYTVSAFYLNCEVFIVDDDGDYVWWYFSDMERCSRARMSYDGKHMLVRTVNVHQGFEDPNPANGRILKISMDGLVEETLDLVSSHHDFTVLPDNAIAYIEYDDDNCDDIMEIDSQGNTTQIFHIADAITPPTEGDGCHSNAINYWPEDNSYTVSVLNNNLFIKLSREGDLIWILGGAENDFAGDFSWNKQHGHHLYDDVILFFNNGDVQGSSSALIYSLDETNLVAEPIWSYQGDSNSQSFGDVQHLSGGNVLVTFSNNGLVREIDPEGELVQEIGWDLGGGVGYTMRRTSLYGPPPK